MATVSKQVEDLEKALEGNRTLQDKAHEAHQRMAEMEEEMSMAAEHIERKVQARMAQHRLEESITSQVKQV